MEGAGLRVVKVTRVPFPQSATAAETIKLTFFDTIWMKLPPLQRLFLYHTDLPLSSMVDALRASLSATLPRFRSLAGNLTHVLDTGDVVVAFSGDDGDGVDLVEAVCEGVDFRRLTKDEPHDVEVFEKFVPVMDLRELPTAVFAVQVTGFAGGGVAVGLSVNHVAIDGRAVWQFIGAWAAECRRLLGRGEEGGTDGGPEPVMDRSVIRHAGGEEVARHYVRLLTPNLPIFQRQSSHPARRRPPIRPQNLHHSSGLHRRSKRPRSWQRRPPHDLRGPGRSRLDQHPPAKAVPADDQPAALCFFLDCRNHLDPPVGDAYFGNCQKPCAVYAAAAELLGDGGRKAGCAAIEKEMEECLKEPLRDCDGWLEKLIKLPRPRRVGIQGWPELQAYGAANFGWGQPRRVELVSMNHDSDVVMVAARDEYGGVQASVALSLPYMDSFASHFLGGLSAENNACTALA